MMRFHFVMIVLEYHATEPLQTPFEELPVVLTGNNLLRTKRRVVSLREFVRANQALLLVCQVPRITAESTKSV